MVTSLNIKAEELSEEVKSLRNGVRETRMNFDDNLELTLFRLDSLLPLSIELKDTKSELSILDARCLYFYFQRDFDKLLSSAEKLKDKAERYGNMQHAGNAHLYMSNVYGGNNFYKKAEKEVKSALGILSKVDTNDVGLAYKANAHIFYSHIFKSKDQPEKAIHQLILANEAFYQLEDSVMMRSHLYVNYSNLAQEYTQLEKVDSARKYLQYAFDLRSEPEDLTWVDNAKTRGFIELLEGDEKTALKHFKDAEEISYRTGNRHRLSTIYEEILGIAKLTNNHELASEYLEKANKIILETSEDKNKVLRQMIEQLETEKSAETHKRNRTLLISGLLLLIAAAFAVWFYRKNKQTKNFQDAKGEIVSLLEMVKNDDPSFMHAFGNTFPNFTKKLLGLSPDLTNSEIEICALIKLKVGTKQIARLRAISHRTVQNKKYSIRKKLNISSEVDFEEWIDNL